MGGWEHGRVGAWGGAGVGAWGWGWGGNMGVKFGVYM